MLKDNGTIISTFRVRADECDRLWVMDTGLADILGDATSYATPSLAIFDLYTDKLIRRHYFPESLLKEDSFFANVVSIDFFCTDHCTTFYIIPTISDYRCRTRRLR